MLLKNTVFAAVTSLSACLLPALAGAQAAADERPSFNIHSSSGVQAEQGLSVILQNDGEAQFEVFLPELLVQMAR